MQKIVIRPEMPAVTTELYVGEGVLEGIEAQCRGKRVVVADGALRYGEQLAKRLGAELITIPSGERAKSEETAREAINALFKMGAGRDTTLIAVGGGTTTDLVGFVAAIYLRGVSLILVPTSLLAIVDAAIGGKTAIDTAFGKNLIGAVYHPKAIFADLSVLTTLPEKEWFNGLAEILKMGLIRDASIWKLAKKNPKDPELILKAIKGKIEVIEKDPTEFGLRRVLNFGHTLGHGLEKVAQYEMPHGEAVMMGCVAESHLSMHLGYLPQQDFTEIEELYQSFPLKLPKGYTRPKLFEAMAHDKKKASGELRFVLIDKIGHTLPFEGAYCRVVNQQELASTLDWMERAFT